MDLGVVLGNGLDIVVPARLFAGKSAQLHLFKSLLLSCIGRLRGLLADVLAHEGAVVSLGQFHGVNLSSQEGDFSALVHRSLDVLSHPVAIRLVLLKHERSGVVAALEVWVQGATALVLRL